MSLYHLRHHASTLFIYLFIYLLLFVLLKRRVLACFTIPILLIKLLSTHALHEIANKQTNKQTKQNKTRLEKKSKPRSPTARTNSSKNREQRVPGKG